MKKKLTIPTYIFTLIWTCVEVNIVSGSPAFFSDWKPSVLILKTISQRNIFAVWIRGLKQDSRDDRDSYFSPLFALCKFERFNCKG